MILRPKTRQHRQRPGAPARVREGGGRTGGRGGGAPGRGSTWTWPAAERAQLSWRAARAPRGGCSSTRCRHHPRSRLSKPKQTPPQIQAVKTKTKRAAVRAHRRSRAVPQDEDAARESPAAPHRLRRLPRAARLRRARAPPPPGAAFRLWSQPSGRLAARGLRGGQMVTRASPRCATPRTRLPARAARRPAPRGAPREPHADAR